MTILGNDSQTTLLRILAYGESQRKKSWWAGAAAEYGFNVLILNGDKPATIYQQLSPAAQSKLRICNALTSMNFSELIARLLRGGETYWDIQTSKREFMIASPPQSDYFKLDIWKLDRNWVLVIDSWTALATSTNERIADDKNVDLSNVGKIEWDLYGPVGLYLDWVLERLKKLPCHLIVIGHPDIWEKQKKNSSGKLLPEIEFTRTQPISSSRPHAKKLAKMFTDTLYFEMVGTTHYIDTSSTSERDGGSTTVPPKKYKWEELQFADFCKAAEIPKPAEEISGAGCLYLPKGTVLAQTEAPKTVVTLQAVQVENKLQALLQSSTGRK